MTEQPQRVLGAVRQSRTSERAISPEAQAKAITAWQLSNGATITRITEDLSRSGGTSAFNRPGLGPYLTDPEKIAAWDVLVVTKLDRACRNVADYLKLSAWCDRHGKKLVILDDPSLDTSTPQGAAMATMRATFAQLERDMAKVRNKERYAELQQQGKWPGGRVPYGFRLDRESSRLVVDNGGTAEILRAMAEMAIAGKSEGQITDWLNGSGHLTMIKRQWKQPAVHRVLHHANTEVVLGEAKAAELRAALRKRQQTRGERVGGHMLLRVAYCRTCGGPLYCLIKPKRAYRGQYRCLPCGYYLNMQRLEQDTADALLAGYGDLEHTELKLVPGDDHQAAIRRIEQEIDVLRRITGTELVITAKEAQIEHLRSLPFDPDRYEPVPQGISVRRHWETLDDQGKGSFLRSRHVRVFADKAGMTFDCKTMTPDAAGMYLVPVTED